MNRYIVLGRPGSGLEEKVKSAYEGKYHVIIDGSAWAVGDSETTALGVCHRLGIVQIESGVAKSTGSGIVIKLEHFYGVYDGALWQRLEAWAGDNG